MSIKLNCDAGESFGSWKMGLDEAIMPYVDMANFACGFHAGDPLIMDRSIKLALKHGVSIGAHPAYPDLMGFGRRSMVCSLDEVESMVIYQIGALQGFATANGATLSYVKPHGGLYNDMMKDERIFKAVATAVARVNPKLKLMILSMVDTSKQEAIAKELGLELIYEVFADRAYDDNGLLVPRTQKGAVLHDVQTVIERLKLLQKESVLETISGKKIALRADTLCVHGDNEEAVTMVETLRKSM
ncbi:5-oxoprolinase subunit PxpA [Sulfurospirillum multivorans]|uniref:5-oxoprolinase subunit A n=2 Tax=Sulfurospirillum multivorans TaxID=66821 RepID=A0AA86ANZ8_SULMK|nr:5-oxoprolinase subunit PxpA [Sulfurospirillum multivorans]AHJ13759.1 LamB-like protein [Sulfurospirillum multivorans DSM 12446]QEH07249.1 LamB-like protein [Sulfurospirillum multivorans]